MKLPRPHIPDSIRLKVALRQLFGAAPAHLDHNPPLAVRDKIMRDGIVIGYKPDANDPDYLVWRTADDHRMKTNVRGDGAQYPDRVLIKRERRRNKVRVVRKIPSRPFPKSQDR